MTTNGEDYEDMKSWILDYDNVSDFVTESVPDLNIINEKYWKLLLGTNYCYEAIRTHCESVSEEEKYDIFRFGIACMSKFVQVNFTGPVLDEETVNFLRSDWICEIDYPKLLTVNIEEININTKYPCLLVAAKVIFKSCQISPLKNIWWQWRCIYIHQKILDELSPSLLSSAEYLQKEIKDLYVVGNLQALFEIEQAQLYCEFRSIAKADAHIKAACLVTGLKYEMFGKLGRRTKHQEKNIAQLTLDVDVEQREGIVRTHVNKVSVPQNIALNDSVRLEKVEFAENNITQVMHTDLEQKLLLLVVQHMIFSKPEDDLYYEELKPFIDLILVQDNTWCTRTSTLLLRSKLETKHNRTIERSLAQCEEIISCIKKEDPHVLNRVSGVYSTGLGPLWRTEEQYADLMLNLGLIKASLKVYMQLQLWEEVIVCYTILKMRHKAAEIIKQQLEVKPTVKLYCLLGDATEDLSCYEKAWEFSKRRSHRAQRHWGQHYFLRKKYLECIPHFEKSVSINPLQCMVWLRLGFAALETNNWQLAATAYRRFTTLEPDGFEAWNNLAQAYIKLGNKRNAHHALQDALRCNFDNWKIWENFLIVSADISNYGDVIRAYHKLIDLKEKYLNIDVLKVLIYGVCHEPFDEDSKGSSPLMKRARELLGRITAIYPGNGTLWELYANVAPIPLLRIQRLQRAYRGYTQGSWTKEVDTVKQALLVCMKLGEAVLEDCISPRDTVLNSVRLNISSAIAVIKKLEYSETKVLLQDLTTILAKVIEKNKNG